MPSRVERFVLLAALVVLLAAGGAVLRERVAVRAARAEWMRAARAEWMQAAASPGGAGGDPVAASPEGAAGGAGVQDDAAEPTRRAPSERSAAEGAPELVVHVAGAVRRPGVYRLPRGARVADAVQAAGGPAGRAWLDGINLAAPLADGVQVYVPAQGEPAAGSVVRGSPADPSRGPGGGETAGSPAPRLPLDLNRATAAELEELPGIGPALAARIVAHRSRRGPFRSVEDLLEVRGVGPRTLEALRPYVTVR